MTNNRGFIALPILIFAAAVAVGVAAYFGGYFDIVAKKATIESNKMGEVVVDETDASNGSTSLTAGWQTYRNEEYGFEVKYPEGWSLFRGDEGGFSIERDRPKQMKNSHEFSDGAIFVIEASSTEDVSWVKNKMGIFKGDLFSEYGFTGLKDVREEIGDESIFGYRTLLSDGIVAFKWSRANYEKSNDFAYDTYLLPILSTFRFIK